MPAIRCRASAWEHLKAGARRLKAGARIIEERDIAEPPWLWAGRCDQRTFDVRRAPCQHISSHDGRVLIWKDGTRMSVSDGRRDKSFEEKLRNPSILDQLSIPL
jgi:hypothetical protein